MIIFTHSRSAWHHGMVEIRPGRNLNVTCSVRWDSSLPSDQAYFGVVIFTCYFLPLAVLSFCYYKIHQVFKQIIVNTSHKGGLAMTSKQALLRKHQKSVVYFLGIIAGFLIPQLPCAAVSFLLILGSKVSPVATSACSVPVFLCVLLNASFSTWQQFKLPQTTIACFFEIFKFSMRVCLTRHKLAWTATLKNLLDACLVQVNLTIGAQVWLNKPPGKYDDICKELSRRTENHETVDRLYTVNCTTKETIGQNIKSFAQLQASFSCSLARFLGIFSCVIWFWGNSQIHISNRACFPFVCYLEERSTYYRVGS